MQRFFLGKPRLLIAICSLIVCQAAADNEDAGQKARRLVDGLQGNPQRAVAKEPIERARAILARADTARKSDQEGRALLLDEHALEWAHTGVDLIRAHELEAEAEALEKRVTEAETNLRRARVLLEETETRRGRARAEVLRLEPEALDGWVSPTTPVQPSAAPPAATAAPSGGTP